MTPAEAEERAIIAVIGDLGAAELAAVKAWIASGCEGPQPRPDVEKRRALAKRLMAAVEAHAKATDYRVMDSLSSRFC